MTDYLPVGEVLAMHAVRHPGLLDAALFRPQTGYYADPIEEAAALWESLAQNHPFIDGNKRSAFAATYTQLVDGLNQASGGLGSEFESVLNLTPILTTAGVCPTQAAANSADFQKFEANKSSASTGSTTASSTAKAVTGAAANALKNFDPNLPVK